MGFRSGTTYPEISLKEAREKRDEAWSQITKGFDPTLERKAIKVAKSEEGIFDVVAREWHAKYTVAEWSTAHSKNILSRLEKNVFPRIGSLHVGEIKPLKILEIFHRIEKTGHLETLHRTLSNCDQVFRYAISTLFLKVCHKKTRKFLLAHCEHRIVKTLQPLKAPMNI